LGIYGSSTTLPKESVCICKKREQQLNRGSKYIENNKHNNENSKLLCVVCNEIQFKSKKNKASVKKGSRTETVGFCICIKREGFCICIKREGFCICIKREVVQKP
jgi:hypothetical protein